MKKLKRLWNILKITGATKIIIGFLIFTIIISLIITFIEPSMHNMGDSLWYSFSIITTIGFGDFSAVTLVGRILSVLLGIYAILVVALIPGILVSYYMEFMNNKETETIGQFLEKLEHLDELSKEELSEISHKVKNNRYRS